MKLSSFLTLFSCKDFSGRMSRSYDEKLGFGSRLAYYFHYGMCFTCRRVKAQIDKLQEELPDLCNCRSIRQSGLSSEAKARIKSNLSAL